MAGYRIDRVSEDIKRELAAIIRELKDPRVQDVMLTVVNVDVSSDASFAKVYVSAMDGIETAKLAVAAGANVLVAGSSVFNAKDRRAAIDALR